MGASSATLNGVKLVLEDVHQLIDQCPFTLSATGTKRVKARRERIYMFWRVLCGTIRILFFLGSSISQIHLAVFSSGAGIAANEAENS